MDIAHFLQHHLALRVAHRDCHHVGAIAQLHGAPVGQRQRAGRIHHHALVAQGIHRRAVDFQFHLMPGLVLDGYLDHRQGGNKTRLRMQPFGAGGSRSNPFVVVGQNFDQLLRGSGPAGGWRRLGRLGLRACNRHCRQGDGRALRGFGGRRLELQRQQALRRLLVRLDLHAQANIGTRR